MSLRRELEERGLGDLHVIADAVFASLAIADVIVKVAFNGAFMSLEARQKLAVRVAALIEARLNR